jgi:transcriptional regulator with XRE-family HTH domain
VNVLADFAAYDARAEFGDQVRRLMFRRRVSTKDLAARVGLSSRQINRILGGTSGPALRHMAAIARELGADLRVELVTQQLRAAKG